MQDHPDHGDDQNDVNYSARKVRREAQRTSRTTAIVNNIGRMVSLTISASGRADLVKSRLIEGHFCDLAGVIVRLIDGLLEVSDTLVEVMARAGGAVFEMFG